MKKEDSEKDSPLQGFHVGFRRGRIYFGEKYTSKYATEKGRKRHRKREVRDRKRGTEKEELKFKLMNVKKEETPKAIPKHRYSVLFEGQ